jgi:hypothetical protein
MAIRISKVSSINLLVQQMYLLESKSSDLGTWQWLPRRVQIRPNQLGAGHVPKSEDLDSSDVPKDTLYQKIYASVIKTLTLALSRSQERE